MHCNIGRETAFSRLRVHSERVQPIQFLRSIEAVGRVADPPTERNVASSTDLSGSLTRRPTTRLCKRVGDFSVGASLAVTAELAHNSRSPQAMPLLRETHWRPYSRFFFTCFFAGGSWPRSLTMRARTSGSESARFFVSKGSFS